MNARQPLQRRGWQAAGWVFALSLAAQLGCSPLPASETPANVVLITVDTLRADRIGAYGYEPARTPRLDALAEDSIRFDRAYAHSSMTLPSIASLLTGVLPKEHGLYSNHGSLPDSLPTLATQLHDAGFATAAFLGNYALRPDRRLFRGFESYTRNFQSRETVRPQPENLAGPLTDQAITWLRGRDPERRLFLWVHYQEPHGPYTPPDFEAAGDGQGRVLPQSESNSGLGAIPRYQWLGHGRTDEYSARYDGEIAEMDRQFGRLLDALRDEGVLADCVLAFASDHGEALGEDGLWFAHGENLAEPLLRVPLLLHTPGQPASVRRDRVRLIDVAPTLLEVLGLDATRFAGQSLLRDLGDRPVVAQVRDWRSLRDRGVELIQKGDRHAQLRGELPGQDRRAIKEAMSVELQDLAPLRWDADEPALSPKEAAALKALGYVD